MEIIHLPKAILQRRRVIPTFAFGPHLLAHHSGALMSEIPPADPRDHQVIPDHGYHATPESIASAKAAAAAEYEEHKRSAAAFDIRKEQTLNQLTAMVGEFGYAMVAHWLAHVGRTERP